MELMQLEMFVAVVEEGSVRAAAERVFRTQPAVSIAVSKLEREFEAPLFDRSKRHEYRLTQACRLFVFAADQRRLSRVAEGTGPTKPQQPGSNAPVLLPAQHGRDKVLV
jgi:DNA-binding transcriptional LysR family regulator